VTANAPAETDILRHGFRAHPLGWLRCVYARLDRSRSFGLAAEMAFWLFLSLLPLAAVAGLVAARISVQGASAKLAVLLDSLPATTRDLLTTELTKVAAWNGGQVGVGAAVMFVWLASSGVHSVFDGLELESDSEPRPWWKKRLLAVATCVALSIGIAVLAVIAAGLGRVWHLTGGSSLVQGLGISSSVGGRVGRVVAGALVSLGLVCGLYWVALPPGDRRKDGKIMPLVPGAIVAVLLQGVVGFGYGFYIQKLGDGGAYQAGLASIGVTMMALYLFCLVLLIGTKVNQLVGEHRHAAD
jgi:membrane protein